MVSTLLCIGAGALVAALGRPIQFAGFRSLIGNFLLSAVIGIAAGLSESDDSGRRYLIGVAAAVQLAVFPVWFGAAAIVGLPGVETVRDRFFGFLINGATIAFASATAYRVLHRRTRATTRGETPRR
jgi:hypothetical protein